MRQMLRKQREGTFKTQRVTLTEWISNPGWRQIVSFPQLEPEIQGQHASGRGGLGIVQELKLKTSIQKDDKGVKAFFKTLDRKSAGLPIAYPGHLDLVLQETSNGPGHHIQVPRQVVMAQLTRVLTWVIVA